MALKRQVRPWSPPEPFLSPRVCLELQPTTQPTPAIPPPPSWIPPLSAWVSVYLGLASPQYVHSEHPPQKCPPLPSLDHFIPPATPSHLHSSRPRPRGKCGQASSNDVPSNPARTGETSAPGLTCAQDPSWPDCHPPHPFSWHSSRWTTLRYSVISGIIQAPHALQLLNLLCSTHLGSYPITPSDSPEKLLLFLLVSVQMLSLWAPLLTCENLGSPFCPSHTGSFV